MAYQYPLNGGRINATIGGNTAGAGSLISTGTLTLAGGNNITLSQVGNAVTISGGAGGGGGGIALANSQTTYTGGTANLNVAGGAMTIASTTGQSYNFSVPQVSSFSATGALSMSANGGTISMGVLPFDAGVSNLGNTSGTTGSNTNGLFLVGGNNITLSQSTNAVGAYVTISGGGGGGAGTTLSRWEHPSNAFGPLSTVPQGSLSIQHVYVPFSVTGTAMKIGGSLSVATNTSATTASVNSSLWMGIYTLTGSTLSLMSSGSTNNGYSLGMSASTTGISSITGMRQLTVPMNVNMTPGEYWVAAAISSASTYTASSNGFTIYGNSVLPTAAGLGALTPIGSNTTANRDVLLFQGIYTAVTSAGPATMSGGHINNTSASNIQRAAFYHAIFNTTY